MDLDKSNVFESLHKIKNTCLHFPYYLEELEIHLTKNNREEAETLKQKIKSEYNEINDHFEKVINDLKSNDFLLK